MKDEDREPPPETGEPDHGDEWEVDGAIVQVPDGEYELRFLRHVTGIWFGGPKVLLHFAIFDGEFAGTPVVRHYNVSRLKGEHGHKGQFVPPAQGDFCREMLAVGIDPFRRDRPPISKLKGRRIIGEVVKSAIDSRRNLIPEDARSSKIARLVRCLPNENWQT